MTNRFRTSSLSDAQYAVLGLLTHGERSGYDLSKLAEGNVDLILAPTKSHIYSVLPQLLHRGLVARRDVTQQRRPDKQVYRLTAAGRTALTQWLNDTSRFVHRDQLLLKLFFGSHADTAALLEQVQAFLHAKHDELGLLDGIGEELRDDPAADAFFRRLTVACGLDLTRAQARWAERAARELQSRVELSATAAKQPI
jgi:DNA-binding PadR family transcriptional regulator